MSKNNRDSGCFDICILYRLKSLTVPTGIYSLQSIFKFRHNCGIVIRNKPANIYILKRDDQATTSS